MSDFTPLERRRHRVLDSLLKTLERAGARIRQDERGQLYAELQGESIQFQLREKLKQVRKPLTDEEKLWHSPGGWRQELEPTGRLAFSIKTYLPPGLKSEWLEAADKPIEVLLPEIIATIVAAAPLLAEQTRGRQQEARQRQIAEEKRHEEQQRQKHDTNRWRRFLEMAQDWKDTELAREFIAALKRTGLDPDQMAGDSTIATWLAWADERVQSGNPINSGAAAIFRTIAAVTPWDYRD